MLGIIYDEPIYIKTGIGVRPYGIYGRRNSLTRSFFFPKRRGNIKIKNIANKHELARAMVFLKDEHRGYEWKGPPRKEYPIAFKDLEDCFIVITIDDVNHKRKSTKLLIIDSNNAVFDIVLPDHFHVRYMEYIQEKESFLAVDEDCVFRNVLISLKNGTVRIEENKGIKRATEKKRNIVKPDRYLVHKLSADNSKAAQILLEYVQSPRSEATICVQKNEFEDDDSINMEVKVPLYDKITMGLIIKTINNFVEHKTYGIPTDTVIEVAARAPEYYKYIIQKSVPNLEATCDDIVEKYMEKYGINKTTALRKMYDDYYVGLSYQNNFYVVCEYYDLFPSKYRDKVNTIYSEVYEQMIMDGKVCHRWKSEKELFKLVKNCLTILFFNIEILKF